MLGQYISGNVTSKLWDIYKIKLYTSLQAQKTLESYHSTNYTLHEFLIVVFLSEIVHCIIYIFISANVDKHFHFFEETCASKERLVTKWYEDLSKMYQFQNYKIIKVKHTKSKSKV